jgi:hypothetical protein
MNPTPHSQLYCGLFGAAVGVLGGALVGYFLKSPKTGALVGAGVGAAAYLAFPNTFPWACPPKTLAR